MKTQLMLGAIVASLALTGCNNFRLETSIPTFELALASSKVNSVTSGSTTTYSLDFQLEAYTLPGSPAGTIVAINLVGGQQLPAGIIAPDSCPTNSSKLCGPYTLSASLNLGTTPPSPGSVKVESVVVKGLTGNSRLSPLPVPLPIY